MQKKHHSLIEVISTSVIKLVVVSLVHAIYLKIILGISMWAAIATAGGFSFIALALSIVIGYGLRRFFNKVT